MKFLLAILMLLIWSTHSIGQVTDISVKEWVKKLSDPEDKKGECYQLFYDSVICKKDTSELNGFLKQLEVNGNSHNIYFITRLNVFRVG